MPQEINTLGITFGEADQESLLIMIALVTLYFLVAFAVYGYSDLVIARLTFYKARGPEWCSGVSKNFEQINRERAEELEQMKAKQTETEPSSLST